MTNKTSKICGLQNYHSRAETAKCLPISCLQLIPATCLLCLIHISSHVSLWINCIQQPDISIEGEQYIQGNVKRGRGGSGESCQAMDRSEGRERPCIPLSSIPQPQVSCTLHANSFKQIVSGSVEQGKELRCCMQGKSWPVHIDDDRYNHYTCIQCAGRVIFIVNLMTFLTCITLCCKLLNLL